VRNRRVANARLKRELDYRFRYPSYVEGEQAIEAEEGAPAASPTAPPPPAVVVPLEPPRSTDALRQLADRLAEAIALLDDGDARTARATLERARDLLPGIEGDSKKN
jgi:hypothetical protein